MPDDSQRAAIRIRPITEADWPAVWGIIEPVFRAGETYAFAQDIAADEAYRVWVEVPCATFVASQDDGEILGTYYLKPNHPGPGSHVCNCGYIVSSNARSRGIASEMCEHSQREAVTRGFRAMQYNLVAATNTGAVRLWKRHGFQIVGTLPQAFEHPRDGYVDAYVMYKALGA